MKKVPVYVVFVAHTDEPLISDIDNIYPTEDSAVKHAKKVAGFRGVYNVYVTKADLTEEYGMKGSAIIFQEKHEERL